MPDHCSAFLWLLYLHMIMTLAMLMYRNFIIANAKNRAQRRLMNFVVLPRDVELVLQQGVSSAQGPPTSAEDILAI